MNHEHESREQLPEVKGLFRRAGELAVLHGRVNDIDNENETLRQFILDKFSKPIDQEGSQLREIMYTPTYMNDYAPSEDALWITFVKDGVQTRYELERNESDVYTATVEHTTVEQPDGPYISKEQNAITYAAMKAAFGKGSIDNDAVAKQVENIDFLLTRDTTPTLKEILMLDEIITLVAAQYPRK